MEEILNLLRELTTEEKAALVAGTDFMFTNPVPRLDIPQIRMSDGPHGLRVQNNGGDNGVAGSEPATSFPTAALTACGWNESNLYKMGEAIGEETRHYGIDVVLGPGVNIKRNPLAGRNFEYFSEDPLIAGNMGAAEIKGIQSKGAGVSLKHFALNNAENYRFMGDSVCDERAMREIYLKAFEIAVKTAKPETVMCAYNKINGTYCCQNKWLLTDVLRKEWGFSGLVMTDWGATHDRIEMLKAGLDLEMPGDTAICRKWIIDGIKSGELTEETLDKAVENVLKLVYKHAERKTEQADFAAHDLEFRDHVLPLHRGDGILRLFHARLFERRHFLENHIEQAFFVLRERRILLAKRGFFGLLQKNVLSVRIEFFTELLGELRILLRLGLGGFFLFGFGASVFRVFAIALRSAFHDLLHFRCFRLFLGFHRLGRAQGLGSDFGFFAFGSFLFRRIFLLCRREMVDREREENDRDNGEYNDQSNDDTVHK